jgi:hypothetical protein
MAHTHTGARFLTADNSGQPLIKTISVPEAIRPHNLRLWVQAHRAEFARVQAEFEPWYRPRECDVRLVETPEGMAVTDEWIPDDSDSNIDPRPVPMDRALASFLTMLDATPGRVLAFVRRFGCLGLTPEGVPFEAIENGRITGSHEPVACYARYAHLAAAVLRLAAGLERRSGGKVPLWEEDIESIRECWRWYEKASLDAEQRIGRGSRAVRPRWFPFDFVLPAGRNSNAVMETVADTVNWWTRSADVRPYLYLDRDGWKHRHLSGGLWGAIGMQLAAAVTNTIEGLRCENCGRLVRRKRRHQGTSIYCARNACMRVAWQKQKQRQRA